jgi:hypothetical protein
MQSLCACDDGIQAGPAFVNVWVLPTLRPDSTSAVADSGQMMLVHFLRLYPS